MSKDRINQLEQARLDLIRMTIKLRAENEKLKAKLKKIRSAVR